MKTHFLRISVLAAAAAAGIYAQTLNAVKANVPFDFTVGSKTVRAGQYIVEAGQGMVTVRSIGGHTTAFAIGCSLLSPLRTNPAKLVFHRYGDRYFLSQVWTGEQSGRELTKTKSELELNASRVEPEHIFLLASR
jgi:hypothetical protein